MKRHLIATLMVGLALMAANGASAGPFEDGEAAYQRDDYATALRLWKPLADKGEAKAQYSLGLMYYVGLGGVEDEKEAARWYQLAAEQGHMLAQSHVGFMYYKGTGVAQDYKEAARWFRLAAEQGDPYAQEKLGFMYNNGWGVAQDDKEAARWFRLAAKQGDPFSQSLLSLMYDRGQGVAQDYALAHMWNNIAASLLTGEESHKLSTLRAVISEKMTPAQIAEAQEMARKCQASNFKQCGEDGDSLMDKVRGWFSK